MKEKCSMDGCGRTMLALGFCQLHYMRQRRGTTMDRPIQQHRGDLRVVSTRVSSDCAEKLDDAGGQYVTAASVLENWATKKVAKRKRK